MTPTPIARLLDDHRLILRALGVLETAAALPEGGASPPARWWDDLIGWLRSFADANHLDKENGGLFPLADAVLDDPARERLDGELEAVESDGGHGMPRARAEAELD